MVAPVAGALARMEYLREGVTVGGIGAAHVELSTIAGSDVAGTRLKIGSFVPSRCSRSI